MTRSNPRRQAILLSLAGSLLLALLLFLAPQAGRASDRDCLLACVQSGTNSVGTCATKCNAMQIDHRCLSGCMTQGGGAYACRQKCSYIKPEFLHATKAPTNTQFAAPIPVGADSLSPSPIASPPTVSTPSSMLNPNVQPLGPTTNYKCVAQCVQQGLMGGLCYETCSY